MGNPTSSYPLDFFINPFGQYTPDSRALDAAHRTAFRPQLRLDVVASHTGWAPDYHQLACFWFLFENFSPDSEIRQGTSWVITTFRCVSNIKNGIVAQTREEESSKIS